MKKLVKQLVSVACITTALATTAFAETKEAINPLTNLYQRVDVSDVDGFKTASITDFKYWGNKLTDKQVKLLEGMSYDVKGMEITKDNVTIKPIKIIGDRNFAYTIFEVTANNGRKLDGGVYNIFLDELDSMGYQIIKPEATPANAVRGDVNVEIMKDENPQDNKLWLLTKTDITDWRGTADVTEYNKVNNMGKNLYYNIPKLVEMFGSKSDSEGKKLITPPGDTIAANGSVVAKGPFTFSIPIKYEDTTKKYTFNKKVKEKRGSTTIEYRIDTVEISPISIVVRGLKESAYREMLPLSLKKKDGTAIKLNVFGGYRDGNLRATCLFNEPIDITEIQAVVIADTEFELK